MLEVNPLVPALIISATTALSTFTQVKYVTRTATYDSHYVITSRSWIIAQILIAVSVVASFAAWIPESFGFASVMGGVTTIVAIAAFLWHITRTGSWTIQTVFLALSVFIHIPAAGYLFVFSLLNA